MGLKLITQPTIEPVALADAKLHVRETDTGQDSVIAALITGARKLVEERTRISLNTQTWQITLDQFPSATAGSALWAPFEIGIPRIPPGDSTAGDLRRKWVGIRLPRGPVQSLTSLTYIDGNNIQQTITAAQYELDTTAPVAILCPTIANPWPPVRQQLNAVTITYVTGWGPLATDVPGDIVAAIKLLIGHFYENREAVTEAISRGGLKALMGTAVPFGVEALIASYERPEAV